MHEVHTSAGCPKQGLRVLAAMPTVGEIGSADLCGWRFVKEKSAAQIVDEHGLDDGMSKPDRKTRQGHRLTRTGAVEEFGSEDIDRLHADANLAAQELAACTQMWIRQRAAACASQGLDLARCKTWTKDYPRHVNDSPDDAARAGSWGCQVGMQNVGSGSYGYPRSWDHGGWTWGLTKGYSQPTKDHGGSWGENFPLLVDNGATMFMGEHGWDSVPLLP